MTIEIDPGLVKGWIALQYTDPKSSEYEKRFDAFEPVSDMTYERPEEAWAFIVAVMEADSSELILGSLSAGPLEDLLGYHGAAVIDLVEAAARANPKVAFLLGGVWRNAIAQEIWERVCAVRDRRGWDGWKQELHEVSAGSFLITLRDATGSIRYTATGSDTEALSEEAKKWLSLTTEEAKSTRP